MFLVTPLHSRMHVIFLLKEHGQLWIQWSYTPSPLHPPEISNSKGGYRVKSIQHTNTKTHRLSTVEGCNRRKMNG